MQDRLSLDRNDNTLISYIPKGPKMSPIKTRSRLFRLFRIRSEQALHIAWRSSYDIGTKQISHQTDLSHWQPRSVLVRTTSPRHSTNHKPMESIVRVDGMQPIRLFDRDSANTYIKNNCPTCTKPLAPHFTMQFKQKCFGWLLQPYKPFYG